MMPADPSFRWMNAGNDCNGWTNNTGASAGELGQAEQTDYRYVSGGNNTCDSLRGFFCVEQ